MAYGQTKKANLIIDIETLVVPVTQPDIDKAMEAYEPPSNYKNPEVIERHKKDFEEGIVQKLYDVRRFSFGGKRMVCCALGRVDEDERQIVDVESWLSDDLSVVCKGIVDYLNEHREYRMLGWNHANFDLPEVAKSFHKTGIIPRYKPSKWDIIDVKDKFRGCTPLTPGKKAMGLKEAAESIGLDLKDVNGADVAKMYADGEFDLIKEYNEHDIIITGEVFLAMNTIFSFY